MICKKCGHKIGSVDKMCENCGSLIEIEQEEKKFPKKGKHIDIEDIVEEKDTLSFNETKRSVKNFLLFLLLVVVISGFYFVGSLIIDTAYETEINQYKEILKYSKLGVIYLGSDDEIASDCNDYSINYEFDFIHLETNRISKTKQEKIKKELNIYNVNSTIVIVQDGVPVSSMNVKNQDDVVTFLRKNRVVPMIIGDTNDILATYKEGLASKEEALIYLSTSLGEDTKEKSKVIGKVSNDHKLNYYEIPGYLLSYKQLKNIMSQLGFSEIQDDLLLYVRNGEVLYILDADKATENYYFQLLSNRGIIDIASSENLKAIDIDELSDMVQDKEKNVIFIAVDNCKYCDNIESILSQIAKEENIKIYSLDATEDTEKVSSVIKDLGYNEGLTITPFVLIAENNKYIDSIIGLADKDLFMNKFIEYGVIK